jgi:uncharacterized protein
VLIHDNESMHSADSTLTLQTVDGRHLAATLVTPTSATEQAVVLVHGGGVTREEGGFFTRLARGLAEAGVASLRYDLRGHGESDGPQQEATLAAHLNDIAVALAEVRHRTGASQVSLLGASFGGGLCAYYAAKRSPELTRLVLLNPQLNYYKRYIEDKAHWINGFLDEATARQLDEQGYVAHSPTVKHGRAFLHEVFWISPVAVLGEIAVPTLIVHGTRDTFVPIEASREAVTRLTCEHWLVVIDGAQHGFAAHDDPQYLDPQSQAWQAFVVRAVSDWLSTGDGGHH